MPRYSKKRRVCKIPKSCCFVSDSNSSASITMSVEEYEAIRLIDYMGLNQNDCALQMRVSRATVQAIYAEARKKIARFIVEGINLNIEGGDYELSSEIFNNGLIKKGNSVMKIAVTYENGQVFQHFGHTEQFKVYEVENGKIVKTEIVDTNGQGHGALAGFLFNGGIDTLICGGIGGGARNALAEAGIKLFPGASGDADAQVESFLAGTLNYNPDTMCNHHNHEHGEGHSCGNHGCGSHSCH